jgi:hypothetical protein
MNYHTASFWYIEQQCGNEWHDIYYGYEYNYEEAVSKLKKHRRQERRTSNNKRRKYRLVCQTRQYFY